MFFSNVLYALNPSTCKARFLVLNSAICCWICWDSSPTLKTKYHVTIKGAVSFCWPTKKKNWRNGCCKWTFISAVSEHCWTKNVAYNGTLVTKVTQNFHDGNYWVRPGKKMNRAGNDLWSTLSHMCWSDNPLNTHQSQLPAYTEFCTLDICHNPNGSLQTQL